MATGWREYQDEAAQFFRSVGFDATVDAAVQGARGKHKIDVLVEFKQLGLLTRWIIECKFWKTSIPKEKVLTLQQITQDVGADRAFLLSERGFQSGAIRVARNTNVTLTNLEDLRGNAQDFALHAKLLTIARRFAIVNEPVSGLLITEGGRPSSPPGVNFDEVLEIAADLFMLRIGLPQAFAGQFPVMLASQPGHGASDHVAVRDLADFIARADIILTSAEPRIEAHKRRAQEVQTEIDASLAEFKVTVVELLEKGEDALFKASDSEQARRAALDAMRRVDAAADALRDRAGRRGVAELRRVMHLLIDTIYLYLARPTISVEEWKTARDQVARQLEMLDQVISSERFET